MSNERFIKLIDSSESEFLLEHYPNCFLLLSYISLKARRTKNGLDGLQPGDSMIGRVETSKKCGLSQKQYRLALEKLEEFGFVEIVFNPKNKKPQKRAIKMAIKCNVVNLCNSKVYDINREDEGHQSGQLRANKGPSEGHKQERKEREECIRKDDSFADSPSVVSFSSLSKEENGIVPLEVVVFLENNRISLSRTDLEAWCALYSTDVVIGTFKIMLEQKRPVSNPGGWLMRAFQENYYQKNKNWEICQKFQAKYPSIKIKVLKSYSIDEDTKTEIPYNISQNDLVERLNLILKNNVRRA